MQFFMDGTQVRIPVHLFALIATIVIYLILQSTPTHANEVAAGILKLLRQVGGNDKKAGISNINC